MIHHRPPAFNGREAAGAVDIPLTIGIYGIRVHSHRAAVARDAGVRIIGFVMTPGEDKTPVPPARSRTIRQQIIECLRDGPVSIGMLAGEIGMSEKELQDHLEGLHKQVKLAITPARCGKCGFEFTGRRRTRKPGKCPRCKSTYIEEPLYALAADRRSGAGG